MSRFRTRMGWLLGAAALCPLVWALVVAGWPRTLRVDGETEPLMSTLLPLVSVCGLALALTAGLRAMRRQRMASNEPVAAVAVAADAPDEAAAAPRGLDVHALAAVTAAGADLSELLAMLRSATVLAKPCAELADADGFRIACVRIEALDTGDARRWYSAWLRPLPPSRQPAMHEAERIERCLALLETLLVPLYGELGPLLEIPDPPAAATARTRMPAPSSRPVMLQVCLLTPADFSEAARAALRTWLEPRLAQALSGAGPQIQLSLLPAAPDAFPFAPLDDFSAAVRQPGAIHDVLLLLGVDSSVDADTVRRLESDGRLRRISHPQGEIPGEAAFGLVLAAPGVATKPSRARLHPAASIAIAPSRGVAKPETPALEAAIEVALTQARHSADDCSAIVCDGNGYGSAGIEAAQAMTASLAALDPVADRLVPERLLGRLGAATLPALLCIAATEAEARGGGCLVIPLAMTQTRTTLAVTAATAQAGASTAAAAINAIPSMATST